MSVPPDDWQPGRPGPAPESPESSAESTHVDDLASPFALNALDPEERAQAEAHSRICPSCAELLARDRRVAGVLPFAVPPAAPGPDVKASLFARIAQSERAAVAAAETAPSPRFAVARRHAAPQAPREQPRPSWRRLPASIGRGLFPDRRPLGWSAVLAPIAAVPLLFALALGGWAMSLQGKVDDRTKELEELRARLATMDGLLASDDGMTYELTAGPAAPKAFGKIIADPATTEALLMVWQLSDPASNASYMVWVEDNGQLIHAADLYVDEAGNGVCRLRLDRPLSRYESVHVTPRSLSVGGLASNSVSSVGATGRILAVDALSAEIDPGVGEPEDSTTAP